MKIEYQTIEEIDEPIIVVEIVNKYTKEKKIYKFKEFTVGEMRKVKLMPPKIEDEGTVANSLDPIVYLMNAMMIEGEKITDKTRMHITSRLKSELKDFL